MITSPFVILSASLPCYSPSMALTKHHSLAIELRDAGYAPIAVDGCYKGAREMAWLVPLDTTYAAMLDIGELSAIAQRYGQESILYVQWNGRATLIFGTDPDTDKNIGVWRELSLLELLFSSADAYTEIEGRYYVAS